MSRRVAKLYQEFRERPPTRARSITVKLPKSVMVMGFCDAIQYRTTIDGKAMRFKHTFRKGSMPMLCSDGKRVFLFGGRYRVTERGIVDLSPRGRELE